ncbi:MAG: RsmE family RNA methyltransferase, partial [Acidimicrobiales bacterium]
YALCELEVMSALIERPAPSPRIVIALSLVKGERTEWAVAKLAEVGADEIVPLLCDRTVVRPDPKSALRRHLRMCRVARAASMQARRLFQPRVAAITTLSDAVRHLSATDGHTSVCMADPGGETISPRWPVVFIGPEGGWSEAELSYQLPLVSLGDTMLRVETAAVVAATSLVSFRLQSAS